MCQIYRELDSLAIAIREHSHWIRAIRLIVALEHQSATTHPNKRVGLSPLHRCWQTLELRHFLVLSRLETV